MKIKSRNSLGISALAAIVAALSVSSARAEQTRITNPTSVNAEILGRALSYSLNVDQVLDQDMAAGIGIGVASVRDIPGARSVNATVIPAYFNYYFKRDQASFFGTAGASILANSNDVQGRRSTSGNVQFTSSVAIPNLGLGFENRSDQGWLFRVTGYALFAEQVKPWFGFTFGYSF